MTHADNLGDIFRVFFRIDALEKNPVTPFGQVQKLIELQYDITEEMPDTVRLIANTCPGRAPLRKQPI
jgi:hypothetical protein